MTETQTVDLAAWLTAIWDEEERLAIKAGGDRWILDGSIVHESRPHDDVVDWVYDEADEHIAYHDPASVLARIAADRKILAMHTGNHECPSAEDNCGWWTPGEAVFVGDSDELTPGRYCPTVHLLASPYKGREGWQENWDES